MKVSGAGTAVFTVAAVVGAVAPAPFAVVTAVVSVILFSIGCGVFLWAYAVAVNRSRNVSIGIGGLYFLAGGIAPVPVRRRMMAALVAQVVVAVAAAGVRVYTPVAFGILAPVFGLGLAGLWGARHGRFPARRADT